MTELFTLGFTKKSAQQFFDILRDSGAKTLVDVRLNNTSQLSGFAKRDDLAFFLRELCGMEYVHLPELAPTKEILDEYRKGGGDWALYERKFLALMEQRKIEDDVPREVLSNGCLLCSEEKPHHCHRRLVGDYLQDRWGSLEIHHLG